jgi:hypothetical protein
MSDLPMAVLVAEPYRACHRWDGCSRNWCPLDREASESQFRAIPPGSRCADKDDPDPTRCPISRMDRLRMVSRLPEEVRTELRFGGLYADEFRRREAAYRRQERLTADEREAQKARLLRVLKESASRNVPVPVPAVRNAATGTAEGQT